MTANVARKVRCKAVKQDISEKLTQRCKRYQNTRCNLHKEVIWCKSMLSE